MARTRTRQASCIGRLLLAGALPRPAGIAWRASQASPAFHYRIFVAGAARVKHVLALDQGTTSSRAIVFDERGVPHASAQQEFRQFFPEPGWVEHDAEEIFRTQLACARGALAKTGWSPYLSPEDAYKLDDVRNASRRGDIRSASGLARVLELRPVTSQ